MPLSHTESSCERQEGVTQLKDRKEGCFYLFILFFIFKIPKGRNLRAWFGNCQWFLRAGVEEGWGKKRDGGHWKMPPDIGFDRAKEFVYLLKQRLGERLEEY